MRRSELVTVPSFSPHPAAGSRTCAWAVVSVSRDVGDDDERAGLERLANEIRLGKAVDRVRRHDPERLDPPLAHRLEQSTAFRPGFAIRGLCQKRCTSSRSSGFSISRCAASMLASPPTSRPPMALGWPVIEKGPAFPAFRCGRSGGGS
jgi:hypothetical protein